MASPLEDPLSHSTDTDVFHFPGNVTWNVHEAFERLIDSVLGENSEGISKFMFLELIAAGLCLLVFIPFALQIRLRGYPKGTLPNLLETLLVFIRDEVAEPTIGHHDAKRFLPFLWSMFFFILFNNLLGMLPYMGSATAALGCTAALAFVTFLVIHGGGIRSLGVVGYAKAFVPHVPLLLYPLMFVIELLGHLIKPTILAVRLFVNMLAGHTVLYVILGFISVIGPSIFYFVVTPASVGGVLMVSMLELFVAFLQAYVFVFLSAIFIGAAVHPQH